MQWASGSSKGRDMTDRLGIEGLTVMGLPPVEFVGLAADLGVRNISLTIAQGPVKAWGHPEFNLASDVALRRELGAALQDRGVSISLGEGFVLFPGLNARALAAERFDAMLELGVRRINVVSMGVELAWTLDEFAVMAELAEAAGFAEVVTEFAPVFAVRDLPMALDAVRHVGRPNFKILVDTMHLGRTGGTPADLAALDPALIGYIQLCDAPRVPVDPDYMHEAMYDRKTPGEGELPLFDMLAAMPRDLVVSVEIPQMARAQAGADARQIVTPIVEASRALLARVAAA
jgi:sugar phosphate isomerase/epimerase